MIHICLLLILISSVVLSASTTLKPVSLQLQWKHQFQFAGFYMAKYKGYYKDAGLDVDIKEYHEGIDIINDVAKGKTKFATGRSSLILHQDKDLLLLAAIFQSTPFVLHALNRNNIQTLKDIKNKRVMVSDSLSDMAPIIAMLKAEGIHTYDFKVIKHSYNPDDLISGKTDFMSSYISNEPFVLKEQGIESIIFNPREYGFDFYGDILYTSRTYAVENPEVVEKFYHASLKGWEYAFSHINESISVIHKFYNSQHKSTEALRYEGKVLKKLAYKADVSFGTIEAVRLREIANTYRLLGISSDIGNDYTKMIYNPLKEKDNYLTPHQKAYLQNKNSLKMCINPDWMPFEKLENGTYIGMNRDIITEVQKRIGIPIEIVQSSSLQESMKFARQKKCDIFSLMVKRPYKEKYLDISDPYFIFPMVIATTMDKPYIVNMDHIADKKIAVLKGYAFAEIVKQKYPHIVLTQVNDIKEGLQLVEQGSVFGYIGILPTVNYEIQKKYIGRLKINGQFENEIKFGFGVRDDAPELFAILQKVLKQIDPKFKHQIANSWMQITYEKSVDPKTLIQWFGIIAVILLLILYKYMISLKYNRELKDAVKGFEMLMESTMEGIIIFDKEGICIQTNSVAAELFGYKRDEIIGKHASMLVSDVSRALIKARMKIHNQAPYEAKMLKKDKTEFIALLRGRDIIFNGQPIRVSTIIDISGLKHLQYELEILNSDLEKKVKRQVEDIRQKDQLLLHQNKLASMGEMIGAIAHQWRQPLNILNINIQNLDDDFEEGMIDRKFIDHFIQENSKIIQFMSQTIDDFRNFYRIDKLKECFFVQEAINMALSMQSAQLKHCNIGFSVQGNDFCITGYKHEFQQAILNLVNNAADAISRKRRSGGKIDIILQNEIIMIQDNGGGIDTAIIDRIFEPYYTTKAQGEGTGIGLYMSKIIIEKNMGGKLEVKNAQKGAKFTINLKGLCKLVLPQERATAKSSCFKKAAETV